MSPMTSSLFTDLLCCVPHKHQRWPARDWILLHAPTTTSTAASQTTHHVIIASSMSDRVTNEACQAAAQC